MPHVNCPECGVRGFAFAPWSTVDRCPTCEAPLALRQSVPGDLRGRSYRLQVASLDSRRAGSQEPQGKR